MYQDPIIQIDFGYEIDFHTLHMLSRVRLSLVYLESICDVQGVPTLLNIAKFFIGFKFRQTESDWLENKNYIFWVCNCNQI